MVSPALIYSSALRDFDRSFPCSAHLLPITAFLTPHVVSGVIDSCFSSWLTAEALAFGDTAVCQPRSRVAGGSFGPGGHGPRAVGEISTPRCACAAVLGSTFAASSPKPELPSSSAHQQRCLPFALRSAERLPRPSIAIPVSLELERGVPGVWCS